MSCYFRNHSWCVGDLNKQNCKLKFIFYQSKIYFVSLLTNVPIRFSPFLHFLLSYMLFPTASLSFCMQIVIISSFSCLILTETGVE